MYKYPIRAFLLLRNVYGKTVQERNGEDVYVYGGSSS